MRCSSIIMYSLGQAIKDGRTSATPAFGLASQPLKGDEVPVVPLQSLVAPAKNSVVSANPNHDLQVR